MKFKKIVVKITTLSLLVALLFNFKVSAAEIIFSGGEEQMNNEIKWQILEILGLSNYDEDGNRDYSVLEGPGVDEDFNKLLDIAQKWKYGDLTEEEKESLRSHIFGEIEYYVPAKNASGSELKIAPLLNDYENIVKFNKEKISDKKNRLLTKSEEQHDDYLAKLEETLIDDEERYGTVTLECELLEDDFKMVCKGKVTPLSILKKAGLKVYTKSSAYGQYIYKINDKEEKTEGLHGAGWVYYVNGEWGTVACDKYECKKGDVIYWEYMTW